MPEYKTPNVYVEEISNLPPSVAGVATAIPAFIGYTEKAQQGDADLTNVPTRISTFLEYTELFGGPKMSSFEVGVSVDATTKIQSIDTVSTPTLTNLMYHSVRLYFDNGGGPCYIVSVGAYTATKKKTVFSTGLAELAKEDEPTLLVLTDATTIGNDYYELCKDALTQCDEQQDRFAILDVLKNDLDGATFRDKVSSDYLKYGAAYCPNLQTSLNFQYNDEDVAITGLTAAPQKSTKKGSPPSDGTTTLAAIKTTDTALYNTIQTEIAKKRVSLPPSAAVAGVYARVDRDRGVWKAPANVSLNSVTGPMVKITNAEQENLNVDPTAGKSINAIRAFTGKGTLVWGARTLAGNDNEWRYVPVRRLFIYIEESIQKASSWVVFEPNIAITWLKVRTMIESFLENLWRQGALAGSKPEEAFFVNVGLGKSMTSQDILEGRMIIEIGVAAVRPAEFIILRFSHKLQE